VGRQASVGATWQQVLVATSQCWSLSGDYASLPRYTVNNPDGWDVILERAIKIGLLSPLIIISK
jgi:hypothetical protein